MSASRACEQITFNAENAEPAAKMPEDFSACSASSAFNVVFFHRLFKRTVTVRLKPDTTYKSKAL